MKNITIKPSATIKEAMEALDKTAEKVLLVVDKDHALSRRFQKIDVTEPSIEQTIVILHGLIMNKKRH